MRACKAGIIAAITELKDRTGSSSIAIKKHVQANLPANVKFLNGDFLNALKQAVANGDLVQSKHCYKLSTAKKKATKASKPKYSSRKKAAPKENADEVTTNAMQTNNVACSKCQKQSNGTDEMLLCDGCDSKIHTSCAGLTAVPEDGWLCGSCLEVFGTGNKSTIKSSSMEVISLLDDDSDSETERRISPTSVVEVNNNIFGGASSGGNKKRKKESSNGVVDASLDAIEILDSDIEEGNVDAAVGDMMGSKKPAASAASVARAASKPATSEWRQASSLPSLSSHEPRGNLKDDRNYGVSSGEGMAKAKNNDEEELTVVATKGQNALADFPHSRANCVTHPFATSDKKLHCINCYCYVCDIPAKDCKAWTYHCEASHDNHRWRGERERAKRRAREQTLASAHAPASRSSASRPVANSQALLASSITSFSSSRVSSSTSSSSGTNARPAEFSVRKLLEKVTTVYPVEMTPPIGGAFVTPLRHYQKQSLAFMVDTERKSNRGGWLCDEVGMGKSAVVLALVTTNPPNPMTLATKQQLKSTLNAIDANCRIHNHIHDVKEAYRREESALREYTKGMYEDKDKDRRKELWAAFRAKEESENEKLKRMKSEIHPSQKVKLKPTVIVTSVSLMGQWEDECKKHAPGLIVKNFHSSRKKDTKNYIGLNDHKAILSLNDVDIIISTITFSWPSTVTNWCEFHRVVQDESHLFNRGPSAREECANEICSPRRWGVTATPMTNSSKDLSSQLRFIQGSELDSAFSSLHSGIRSFQSRPSEPTFNGLVDLLQTFMVRHAKSQRINGSDALSLPPSTTLTIMLTMSRDEDAAFNKIHSSAATFRKHSGCGVAAFTAEKTFMPRMSKILRVNGEPKKLMEVYGTARSGMPQRRYIPERLTKIRALRKDLAEHKMIEPNLRCVIFTQYLDVHDACVRGLQQDGFEVHQFTGSSNSCMRDDAIRNFQNTASRKPAVFIVTLRSGSVGITLTSASRVYLLEPCLDPAVEVQAAGRIHRLGQDKPCHVVKFAFKKSYESNIIKLHKKILAGKISIVDGFVPPEAMEILAKGLRFG